MPEIAPVVAVETIVQRIFELRGQRVMLDSDLAVLYGVPTKVLLQAVKRNHQRFQDDFMFQLSEEEWAALRSQVVTSNGRGGRRYAPYAFTEHGSLMLSSVLTSPRAVEISRIIIRAFVWLRQSVPAYQELAAKLAELERAVSAHDQDIAAILDALRLLMPVPAGEKRRIGF
jgi:hypothetical protein